MTEHVVTGKKYRVLTDEKNDEWDRVSFWTSSGDVECDDGESIEEKAAKLQGICLTATLAAGSTSLTFTDSSITEDCFVDVYTNVYGINPETIDTSVPGQLTLIFEEQEQNIQVRVKIRER